MAEPTISEQINQLRTSGVDDNDILDSMTRHPIYGDRVKTALAAGAEPKDILDSLQNGPSAPVTTTGGMLPAVARGAKQVVEGFGSGVASTVTGLRDVASKGTKALGMGELPQVPAVLREAGTTPPDASTAFNVGRGGEQAAEFFLPSGEVAKGAELVGKALKGSKYLGPAAEALVRTGGEMASAGAVRGAQTGGDSNEAKNAALVAGAFTAPFATVNAALKAVKPSALYAPEAFMSHVPERFKTSGRWDDIVGQAIDNNIDISRTGLQRAEAVHAGQTAARDAALATQGGTLVDNQAVYEPLRGLQDLADRFGEKGVVNSINRRIAAVEAAHGGAPAVPGTPATTRASAVLGPNGQPIPVQVPATPGTPAVPGKITVNEAQELKNFGQGLAADMYSRVGDSVGAQKIREELARGFMRSIEEVVPQVRQMNQNLQNTKIMRDAIEGYIAANPSLVNMRTLLWAVVSPKTAGVSLLANPRVRSALAIAAHNNVMSNIGARGGRVIVGGESAMAPPVPQMPVGIK